MKHEADGLYSISVKHLRNIGACVQQTMEFKRCFGDGVIPITFDAAEKAMRLFDPHLSVMVHLVEDFRPGSFTGEEMQNFEQRYWRSPCDEAEAPLALMDLLAARARREGRLA